MRKNTSGIPFAGGTPEYQREWERRRRERLDAIGPEHGPHLKDIGPTHGPRRPAVRKQTERKVWKSTKGYLVTMDPESVIAPASGQVLVHRKVMFNGATTGISVAAHTISGSTGNGPGTSTAIDHTPAYLAVNFAIRCI